MDLDKPDFIGKAYASRRRPRGRPTIGAWCRCWSKIPEPLLYHAEVIYRNGKAVGYIRAASYGFTLGGAVGLAMIEAGEPVNKAYLEAGQWEIDIAGQALPGGGLPETHVRPEDGEGPVLR